MPRSSVRSFVPTGSTADIAVRPLESVDVAPTLVLVSEGDAMRDEGLCYARRLADAGIAVTQGVLPTAECWPGALYEPSAGGCACGSAVQKHLRKFFGAAIAPH